QPEAFFIGLVELIGPTLVVETAETAYGGRRISERRISGRRRSGRLSSGRAEHAEGGRIRGPFSQRLSTGRRTERAREARKAAYVVPTYLYIPMKSARAAGVPLGLAPSQALFIGAAPQQPAEQWSARWWPADQR